jgi:hypothetical protein
VSWIGGAGIGLGRRSSCLGGHFAITSPHEDAILLIYSQFLGVDKFVFHRFKEVIIKLEAHLECPIGHSPFTLE